MPGAMRKLGLYLGLVEDDENDGYDYDDFPGESYEEPVARRGAPPTPAAARRSSDAPPRSQGSVALETAPRPVAVAAYDEGYRITTLHPHTYNGAKAIGENYRNGTPVIMNLSDMD